MIKSNHIKIMLGIFCLVGLFGCASKVEYGDDQAVETVSIDFGSTDLQQIAGKMVDSLLTNPDVIALTAQKKPILVVDKVQNKTLEHIDLESVTDTIVNKLIRSKKFQFTDMSNSQSVQAQLDYQNKSVYVDSKKATRIGKHAAAEHIIYGSLSSIVKSNHKTKDVYYKFTLKMENLTTGLLEWQEEKEIRKQVSRSILGF